MIFLKACIKCRGDMWPRHDQYSEFRQCLQCGHIDEVIHKARPVTPAREVA